MFGPFDVLFMGISSIECRWTSYEWHFKQFWDEDQVM